MWDPMLSAGKLVLLQGTPHHLRGFLQELAHHALHTRPGNVLWVDGDHGFNPHDFAELNLTRGHQADHGAERMLVKRCMTPFQWYTALSRLLPEKIAEGATALALVNPFDRLWSTDELADWEQEDYVRFILPHLAQTAQRHGVPLLLGIDMERWWRTHPVLAQCAQEAAQERWRIARSGGRWHAVRDDGTVLDPLLRHAVTLLDYLPEDERPALESLVVAPRRNGHWRERRTRIVHATHGTQQSTAHAAPMRPAR